ncbi:MAG: Fic family protein [Chloroflexi bacterium]|nr:Fic family protein [Chloroflexota bacterium]
MRSRYVHRVWKPRSDALGTRRYRRPCDYSAFIPERVADTTFTLPIELTADLADAEAAVLRLQQPDDRLFDPLLHLLMRSESIASSRIEGIQVDARDLARAEARGRIGRRVGARAREVISNIEAMQLAIGHAAAVDQVTLRDLLSIHEVLMRGQLQTAGQVRTAQNWIGGNDHNPCGADFVPPPPELVPDLLEDLCAFCNSDQMPPLVQAAIAHAQFETIHPFDDGNGRTGRALMHILLRRRGLAALVTPPISVALAHARGAYINGLVAYRDDKLDEWFEIIASATLSSVALAERYRISVGDLLAEWQRRLREGANPRSDAAAWLILEQLPSYPVLNRADAAEFSGRSLPAVDLGLRQLEDAGILDPIRDQSPSRRSWEPSGLLDLIIELESEAPMGLRAG